MDGFNPFKIGGSTFALAATPSAGPATLIDGPDAGDVTYIFDNTGNSSRVWLGMGASSTVAQANAVIPIIGTPSSALPVAAGTVQSFTLAPNVFVSTIMEFGSGTVYCASGQGA